MAFDHKSCNDCRWVDKDTAAQVTSVVSDKSFVIIPWRKSAPKCLNPLQGNNIITGKLRVTACGWHRAMHVRVTNSLQTCTAKGLWWEPKQTPS